MDSLSELKFQFAEKKWYTIFTFEVILTKIFSKFGISLLNDMVNKRNTYRFFHSSLSFRFNSQCCFPIFNITTTG